MVVTTAAARCRPARGKSDAPAPNGRCWVWLAVALACAAAASARAAHAPSIEDLRQMSIEDLANVEVSSVLKRPEPLSKAPAAIYVITSEDIRRSGAASLPEVLRLAPNLHVARRNALDYAISARGFNGFETANKLLVLIDGRSIYTPLHAGVFWDQQHVMLADIERIEVISGPGGTLWGANAVNGVINVITRSARDTQGGLVDLGYGNVDRQGAARYGGRLGENAHYRAYAVGYEREDTYTADGEGRGDEWDGRQAGFRSDWQQGPSAITVQGDIYDNRLPFGGSNVGRNLLARWTRALGEASSLQVQGYYDRADRSFIGVNDEVETADLQAQHALSLGDRHQVVWGGGYRYTRELFLNSLNAFVLDPPEDEVTLANVFLQDSIALGDDLTLTVGSKLEHSSFTGSEVLPSARLAWEVTDTTLLWSAVSRAVRTPSRIDRELVAPGILVKGDFQSETLIAYEAGYRGRPTADTTLSVSLFYNDYDDLRTTEPAPGGGFPVTLGNGMEGYTYGVETWGDYRILPWWRISGGLTLLEKRFELKDGSADLTDGESAGNDPEYQAQLRSYMNLTDEVELDIGLRLVDDLPDPSVPGYIEASVRIGWHVAPGLELSVAGFNLFDAHHPETDAPARRGEVRRAVFANARWRF